jgi:hypothetical protein
MLFLEGSPGHISGSALPFRFLPSVGVGANKVSSDPFPLRKQLSRLLLFRQHASILSESI